MACDFIPFQYVQFYVNSDYMTLVISEIVT